MKISFDAVPIINGKMTGVGWCDVTIQLKDAGNERKCGEQDQ